MQRQGKKEKKKREKIRPFLSARYFSFWAEGKSEKGGKGSKRERKKERVFATSSSSSSKEN